MAEFYSGISSSDLKILLNDKVEQYNTTAFIKDDPISIPHLFSKKEDIEISGLFMAIIAWGNRKSILQSGQKLLQIFQHEPFEFVQSISDKELKKIKFLHRTFQAEDFHFFIRALKQVYKEHGSLEHAFGGKKFNGDLLERIAHFRSVMLQTPHSKRTEKHLSDPNSGSACKRLSMYLRWMVRKDQNGVDFGLWNSISIADLVIPLDVHTGTIARKLGLISRKQNDRKALDELMSHLRQFDPIDPSKFDYALFGIGVNEKL